jgi:hypothetical protein
MIKLTMNGKRKKQRTRVSLTNSSIDEKYSENSDNN